MNFNDIYVSTRKEYDNMWRYANTEEIDLFNKQLKEKSNVPAVKKASIIASVIIMVIMAIVMILPLITPLIKVMIDVIGAMITIVVIITAFRRKIPQYNNIYIYETTVLEKTVRPKNSKRVMAEITDGDTVEKKEIEVSYSQYRWIQIGDKIKIVRAGENATKLYVL